MKIEGCVALVTGANRGIGLGFVEELLARGAAKVYVAARSVQDGAQIVERAPDRLHAIELDVTREDQVARAAESCPDVTLLVNNAGVFGHQTLLRAPDMSAMRQEMEVNCFGVIAMIRAFAPVISKNAGGAVVNVLSAGGILAVPDMGGYSPSKFAARAAANCLRAELAPLGVHVCNLIVGSVETRMSEHVQREKSQPIDIGRAGLWAVERNLNEHDTDPHAMEVRAHMARDPHGLEEAMAKRFKDRTAP